ncbi:LysR family transcriptional regulator [Gallaecimonas mangrovi]|uniref:LysR family transcriptional regulator n=1 Tax=Gallaecimonas mangrovi TaxID=2291597 RepID=UPI0021F6A876|nr:LysR family transcriptional regulator [Gallaecimonas mangrovi]
MATVEAGSFTAAAQQLAISQQMVAKHVATLEAHLKASLLQRTTRSQKLTAVGSQYFQRCKQILADMQVADALPQMLDQEPQGSLRLSSAKTFGTFSLMPFVSHFLDKYPKIELELNLADHRVNLLEESVDGAFRIGPVDDDSLIARALPPFTLLLCASPDYVARFGKPAHPRDLERHQCLDYCFATPGVRNIWQFDDAQGQRWQVKAQSRLRINESQALLHAALAGQGLTLAPEVMVKKHIASGALLEVMPDFSGPSRPLHFVYRQDRYRTTVMRTLIDEVMAWYGEAVQ